MRKAMVIALCLMGLVGAPVSADCPTDCVIDFNNAARDCSVGLQRQLEQCLENFNGDGRDYRRCVRRANRASNQCMREADRRLGECLDACG